MAGHGVTLEAIAASLDDVDSVSGGGTIVSSVTHDSRKVRSGTLFVAIAGARTDGHEFIDAAIKAGATGVLVEHPVDADVGSIVVPDSRAAMAWAARTVYGRPDEDLTIVGITGTNGKTTVSYMCESIWRQAGRKPGLVGTLGARIEGEPIPIERTTPESSDLQELLASMRDVGVDLVAMEVSSHAMALHRADAIEFEVAAFTNLSQDHLDFHGDMASYFSAKASLFEPGRARRAIVNVDDPYGRRLVEMIDIPCLTVGTAQGVDFRVVDIVGSPERTRFALAYGDRRLDLAIPVMGVFNVANAAIAATISISLELASEAIIAGLETLPVVAGRMEVLEHAGPFTVVVDYAHSPGAISEVLQAARSVATGRVTAVVGAAGDRDRDKRALMGAAAARFADLVIVTSDNPRSEDPAAIAREVRRGADAAPGARAVTVLDRRDAIAMALSGAEPGDIVLILGKGHEQGIERNGVIEPFDDRTVALAALNELGWNAS
jgi:UDP-N-acetylmuramoyl-L-alanyl-D-glutamate--2,6-diaminopimelate ligase